MARPTIKNEAIINDFLYHIVEGYSLRAICSKDEFPAIQTIFRWLQEDEKFREQYARAKQEQAEALADEIVQIADTEKDSQKARVRIDARKWVASKLKPKKYGDKLQHTGDGGGAITVNITQDDDNL